jgi:glycosyltransferase involved in cell wall biosynthesis
VTSNLSSLPEVTGEAAVLVDPYDVGAIVTGMRRVLEDPALADELRRRGLRRAREFSWTRSAEKTLAVYRDVGGAYAARRASFVPASGDEEGVELSRPRSE